MPSTDPRIPLVVIVGATAVGKTALALETASLLGAEIVSADSRLFYRGMDIGTAKPNREERQRVPHHLIDVSNPDEAWSLPLFQQRAAAAIEDIHARGKLAFLVGGTGQYVRAVTEGWKPPEQESYPRMRSILEEMGREIGPLELHRRLGLIDPAAATFSDPANLRRTVRALEVMLTTGRRFSEQRGKGESPYRLLTIGLHRPRVELYARIDARVDEMVRSGLVEEVRDLLRQGYCANLPSMSAIGYREIIYYLQGKATMAEAVSLMKRLTHRYVRQQGNWFREEDETIYWFEAGDVTTAQVGDLIRQWMAQTASS
jgi:tRNA dimethylallyltransferase